MCPAEGFVYIVTGYNVYLQETIVSAQSLKVVDKRAHVTLITDLVCDHPIFDKVITLGPPNPADTFLHGHQGKSEHLYSLSPYHKSLYLDTDTYFVHPCREVFDLLDQFDLCMTRAPGGGPKNINPLEAYPLNAGMIAFRKGEINERLFNAWGEKFRRSLAGEDKPVKNDQVPFMEAYAASKATLFVLPYTYNARTMCFLDLAGPVKIIHNRHRNYRKIAHALNRRTTQRCWNPVKMKCSVRPMGVLRKWYRLLYALGLIEDPHADLRHRRMVRKGSNDRSTPLAPGSAKGDRPGWMQPKKR